MAASDATPHVHLNDTVVSLDEVPVNWTLADLLRGRTPFRGTHLACEHGVCGVCTVLLDGEPVRSCLVLSHAVGERHVTTVEGLHLLDAELTERVREAFLAHNAFQCGFCTPGMLALVFAAARDRAEDSQAEGGDPRDDTGPTGHRDKARRLVNANLCRCTGYTAIVTAAQQVLTTTDRATAPTGADT